MMLQLNPMLPVSWEKGSESINGYAFVIVDYSQEHYLLFGVALDNGEIRVISNRDLKMQNNETLHRNVEEAIQEVEELGKDLRKAIPGMEDFTQYSRSLGYYPE